MPQGCRPAGAEIARWDPDIRTVSRRAAPALAAAALAWPASARAMHLADGVLPPAQAVLWFCACAPFVAAAFAAWRRAGDDRLARPLIATAAALVLALSSVEIPLPLGTSAHACGVGLAAILLGARRAILAALAAVVLQAFLLGHGGVTAIGADLASMGIAGALAAHAAFRGLRAARLPLALAAAASALAASVATYALASLQLALALSAPGAFRTTLLGVAATYAPAELPMAALEAAATAAAVAFLARRRPDLAADLGLAPAGGP
ncbi:MULTISPECIES: energy-coupling factor ABC transporter permease [Anaeromyxobacter]|uniref:energy-coupling factor ABC transporter permease n=3 Tax=Anaeromyxobacteraceae TaxID=1524215 RepID=UPI001F5694E9|nr:MULTISPECIES: energy-coupling factor ABC transporter permease [unclassified Anaeromyxobacter]